MKTPGAQRVACAGSGNGCWQVGEWQRSILRYRLTKQTSGLGGCMLGPKQDMVSKAAGFLFLRRLRRGIAAVSVREGAKRSCNGGALGI
jgi:hypothetical protein